MTSAKVGILERLKRGPVIGDGGFVNQLERRGYVVAGVWTTEAVVKHPNGVKELHREYLLAGADVMQTCTFYSSDDRLTLLGIKDVDCETLNKAGCDLAKAVASEGDALVAGSFSPVPSYSAGKGKEEVMNEYQKQIDVFKEKKVDFILGEFFAHIEEAEFAIEAMKQLNIPIACTMRLGPAGDSSPSHISPKECAVRMAKAGADIVGVNCSFGPSVALETMRMMKEALDEEELSPFLMAQPAGWHTTEVRNDVMGYISLPEFPFAMEARLISRIDAAKFAREAYQLGVRYIGGCCGIEPYHIRAMAEELAKERGISLLDRYQILDQSPSTLKYRCTREYWENIVPAAGRSNVKIFAELDYNSDLI